MPRIPSAFLLALNLRCVQKPAGSVLYPEDVVVYCVEVGCRVLDWAAEAEHAVREYRRRDDAEGVKTGEVEGSCRLELGRVQAVRDDCHVCRRVIMRVTEGCIVVVRKVDPVGQSARLANIHAVNLGLELEVGRRQGVGSVAVQLGVVHRRESDELDGLGQCELLSGVGAYDCALHLGDEEVVRGLDEPVALHLVKVHKVGPALELRGCIGGVGIGGHSEVSGEGNGRVQRDDHGGRRGPPHHEG